MKGHANVDVEPLRGEIGIIAWEFGGEFLVLKKITHNFHLQPAYKARKAARAQQAAA